MSTTTRRDTQMAKRFDLCQIRHIPLHDIEPGQTKISEYIYISPRESLTRLFGDPTVFAQYIVSGKLDKQYDHLGVWHGDYYQSPAYREDLETMPENSGRFPPLLLSAYRFVIIIITFKLQSRLISV